MQQGEVISSSVWYQGFIIFECDPNEEDPNLIAPMGLTIEEAERNAKEKLGDYYRSFDPEVGIPDEDRATKIIIFKLEQIKELKL